MVKINPDFLNLKDGYLFPEIEKRAQLLKQKDPSLSFINLGIGDITLPLPKASLKAICNAANELKVEKTLKGYGPSQGELSIRCAIKENEYKNIDISTDEIFISNGTKNDISAIQELFSLSSKIALCDPTYPVYVDSNVLSGRAKQIASDGTYQGLIYLPCLEENNFIPSIPSISADLIYLCSPNNPTGTALSYSQLKSWVEYAKKNNAVILFDGAYEVFISSKDIPHSIYEIAGADEVAIEFRSFSKTAGFTGLRLSYYIIPKKLKSADGEIFHQFWKRRVDTKYGGTSYPIQMGALALYSERGKKEKDKIISAYMKNTKTLKKGLQKLGYTTYGGIDCPYIWCKTKDNIPSWDFFNILLSKGIITVPGRGFGPSGEGFIRFSGFAKEESIKKALTLLQTI